MDGAQVELAVAAALAATALTYIMLRFALRRIESDRRIETPDGLWWVRLHWSHPNLSVGLARQVFRIRPDDLRRFQTELAARQEAKASGRSRRDQMKAQNQPSSLTDLAGCVADLPVFGLAIFAVIAALLLVGLAIELAVFVVGATALTFARTAFGHPWSIEVDDPDGQVHLMEVAGWRNARAAAGLVKTSIEQGQFDPDAITRASR